VIGNGWGKNQDVAVSWSRGLDRKVVVKADANGAFTIVLLVLSHDFLGFRQAVATQAGTTLPQPFLAVPGTSEPPKFLIRR
jgi:hypothetical protein